MAVTKRVTKGSALTMAEMDANWDELINLLTEIAVVSGSVGIGTLSPDGKLHITGNTSTVTFLKIEDSGTGQARLKLVAGGGETNRATTVDFINAAASGIVPRWSLVNDYNQSGVNDYSMVNSSNNRVLIITQEGDSYFHGDVSAATFTDRTPFYEGDAVAELRRVSGSNGEIDHSTLPAFAQKDKVIGVLEERKRIEKGKEIVEQVKVGEQIEHGRDLGAMISILTTAIQQLDARLAALEGRKGQP